MTETELTMPINLEETKSFIMSPNPTVSENIMGSMSEIGRMIALRDQVYYVPGLPKDLRIISLQGISTSEG